MSNYFTTKFVFENYNLTLGFDATTQEGIHVNCIYVTNGYSVNVVDIEQLSGGTAYDYCGDIRTCLNCLARVYCHLNGGAVIAIEHNLKDLNTLETITSSTRTALKKAQIDTGTLFATDCHDINIVLNLNKLRFNDGSGASSVFKSYLRYGNLKLSYFPRYRGNRLHVLYTLSGEYYYNRMSLAKFLET